MAALTIADELAEMARTRIKRLEEELAALAGGAQAATADRDKTAQAAIAAALTSAAERIEGITKKLNPRPSRHVALAVAAWRWRAQLEMRARSRLVADCAMASAVRMHYIDGAGLPGASGAISPGPYRS